ncbi:hypothetical protein DCC79_16060, partial [bacterium]
APRDVQAALARLDAHRLVVVDHGADPARWALTRRGRARLAESPAALAHTAREPLPTAIDGGQGPA